MDASAVVKALQDGDMTALAASLDWDAVEAMEIGGVPLMLVRKGVRTIRATDDMLTAHDHDSESDAIACWTADVEEARRLILAGTELDPNIMVVPDNVAGFGWA